MGLKEKKDVPRKKRNTVYREWKSYVDREKFWQRFRTAIFLTAIMFGAVFFVLIPAIGMPFYAHRSDFASWFYIVSD